jgi:hypothetical protein
MPRSAVACDPIVLFAAGVLYFASPPLGAQWVNYPTPGVPRTPNGKVNLSAPTPRAPDGKPDLSGFGRPSLDTSRTSPRICGRTT